MKIYKCWILTVAAMLAGCASEEPVTPGTGVEPVDGPQPQTTTVPLTIHVGSNWQVDSDGPQSRFAPPGADDSYETGDEVVDLTGYEDVKNINNVRIITFRRKDVSEKEGATPGDFIYDASNSREFVPVEKDSIVGGDELNGDATHYHRVAHTTIEKVYGYEYKIVALAYNKDHDTPFTPIGSKAGINNHMTLNVGDGLKLDDLQATFHSHGLWDNFFEGQGGVNENMDNLYTNCASVPQVFYGFCTDGSGEDDIVKYSKDDANGHPQSNTQIRGTLYRGMAKVELRLHVTDHKFPAIVDKSRLGWVSLLVRNVLSKVNLSSYYGFNGGTDNFNGKSGNNNHDYVPVDYVAYGNYNTESNADGSYTVLKAYLLPGKVKLGLRVQCNYVFGMVASQYILQGPVNTADVAYGNTATGVISYEAVDNEYYLRRNHYYVFDCYSNGRSSETILRNNLD